MISANSENDQATIITLTETELEGIYGGWGHHGSDNERFSFRSEERFSFRSEERFSFRGEGRFSFHSEERFSFRSGDDC